MSNNQFYSVIDRYSAIMNLMCKNYPRLPRELANIVAEFGLVSLECSECKGVIRYTNEKNICWVEKQNFNQQSGNNSSSILCNKCDNSKFNLQELFKKRFPVI